MFAMLFLLDSSKFANANVLSLLSLRPSQLTRSGKEGSSIRSFPAVPSNSGHENLLALDLYVLFERFQEGIG
jgi:hypothetical protein